MGMPGVKKVTKGRFDPFLKKSPGREAARGGRYMTLGND